MARATRSRGALAKPTTKKAAQPFTKSAAQKPVHKKSSSSKKRGGGNTRSLRRALGDISNNNDDDTEPEEDFRSDQDSVADYVENDNVVENARRGRCDKTVVRSKADDDEGEEVISEQSDTDESDYQETTKKSCKAGVKKNAPAKKTAVVKKEQPKRVRSTIHHNKSSAATSTKATIFENKPKIDDNEFSNLIGLVRKSEENSNFHGDDGFGADDWRCFGAVDY